MKITIKRVRKKLLFSMKKSESFLVIEDYHASFNFTFRYVVALSFSIIMSNMIVNFYDKFRAKICIEIIRFFSVVQYDEKECIDRT